MPDSPQQLSLFDTPPEPESKPGPGPKPQPRTAVETPVSNAPSAASPRETPLDQARAAKNKTRLNAHASLANAVEAYHDHIAGSELSPHTVKSFIYDLNILIEFAGASRPIGQIAQRDLESFMDWLVNGRGVPCNPKSLSRRLVTLKAFFRWLSDNGVIADDPAVPIAHKPVSTPLPDILTDEQVDAVLAAANKFRHDAEKPDTRAYLLITLLLKTGIKKSECMAISLEHIDLSDPDEPALWIRYTDPRYHHKERKLKLDARWPRVLQEYRTQYKAEQALFSCTSRTLEYVLADVGQLANLPK
ncbi:MAG TPA: site-specific integrase, partial [Anaerolineae bacterium]|nr:site-specific integrase [Anaerolineae bacterium]